MAKGRKGAEERKKRRKKPIGRRFSTIRSGNGFSQAKVKRYVSLLICGLGMLTKQK